MNFILKQIEPGNPSPLIILLNEKEVIIGRRSVNSLSKYPLVWGKHAAFHYIDGSLYIRDLSNRDSLFVNFENVGKHMRKLEIGDIIGFGAPSYETKDGFACVLAITNVSKPEVIDLEDDSEDNLNAVKRKNIQTPIHQFIKTEVKTEITEHTSVHETPVVIDQLVSSSSEVQTKFQPTKLKNLKQECVDVLESIPVEPLITSVETVYKTTSNTHSHELNELIKNHAPTSLRTDFDFRNSSFSKTETMPSINYQSNIFRNYSDLSEDVTSSSFNSSHNIELSQKIDNKSETSEQSSNNLSMKDKKLSKDNTYLTSKEQTKLIQTENSFSLISKLDDTDKGNNPSTGVSVNHAKLIKKSHSSMQSEYFQCAIGSELSKVPILNENFKCARLESDIKLKKCSVLLEKLDDRYVDLFLDAENKRLECNGNKNIIEQEALSDREINKLNIHGLKLKRNRVLSSESESSSESEGEENNLNVTRKNLSSNTSSNDTDEESHTSSKLTVHKTSSADKYRNENYKDPFDDDRYDSSYSYSNVESDSDTDSMNYKPKIIFPSPHILEEIKHKTNSMRNSKPVNTSKKHISVENDQQSPVQTIIKNNKLSKTLLIDPKPLEHRLPGRPRQTTSTEKRFRDRLVVLKQKQNLSPVESARQSSSNCNNRQNSQETILDKNAENIIVGTYMKGNKFKIPKCSRKKEDSSSASTSQQQKPKCPTIPRRAANYGSRLAPLLETFQQTTKIDCSNKKPLKLFPTASIKSSKNSETGEHGILKKNTSSYVEEKVRRNVAKRRCFDKELLHDPQKIKHNKRESINEIVKENSSDCRKKLLKNIKNFKESQAENTICDSKKFDLPKQALNTNATPLPKKSEAVVLPFQNKLKAEVSPIIRNVDTTLTNSNKICAVVPPLKSNVQNTTCLESSLSVIKSLVQWNPKWLEEQRKKLNPPIEISKSIVDIPLSFDDYPAYFKTFYNFSLLDLWDLMYQTSKPIFGSDYMNWNNFYCRVISGSSKYEMMELNCEAVVSEKLRYSPLEGDVVLFNVQDENRKVENCIFGYVTEHEFLDLEDSSRSSEWRKIPTKWLEHARLCVFKVYIKMKIEYIKFRTVMLAHGICNVKHKLNNVENLRKIRVSPLCGFVIQPNKLTFKYDKCSEAMTRHTFVQNICNEITNNNPNVFLVRGYPGSGKTHVALELLENLIFSDVSKLRILVCTSSTSAAEEISLRLLDLVERYNFRSKTIRHVIVTDSHKINSKLKPYLFNNCVSSLYHDRKKTETDLLNKLSGLEFEISTLLSGSSTELTITNSKMERYLNLATQFEREINTPTISKSVESINSKIESLKHLNTDNSTTNNSRNKLQKLMKKYESTKNVYQKIVKEKTEYDWKMKVLKEYDVIISTLSCFQDEVANFLQNEDSNFCCIVDEAHKCAEFQLWPCLIKQVNNLVLLGDYKTFQREANAKSLLFRKYHKSMFQRMCLFFEMYPQNPVITLHQQYRMHSKILEFPSCLFYDNKIKVSPYTDERYKYFPLQPYYVLDILDIGPLSDIDASWLLNYMSTYILRTVPSASVGVIVLENQIHMYESFISHNPFCRDLLEINTVDGFRSKEKDVIIVAVIKTESVTNWDDFLSSEETLSILLTRAKQCLMVYGNLSSLFYIKHWRSLLEDSIKRNLYIPINPKPPLKEHIPLVLKQFVTKSM